MKSGLIGYTGFVGSNLLQQRKFDELFNSKNFNEISGRYFSELVCAGISSVKWMANKDPVKDLENIQALINVLKTVQADRFILISTIDVYPVTKGKDEYFDCHKKANHAYGRNRLLFEDFCVQHFSDCYVIRLPALFGKGLKKNVIFDLLNNNMLEFINPFSSFQYYYLKNLWNDIEKILLKKIHLANLFTEPILTNEILEKFFPNIQIGSNATQKCHYDIYTCYSYDKDGFYCYSKEEVLKQLQEFINNYKNDIT